jgi:pimeloyl-ACP methyl ester carboxylesterase
MLLQKSKNGINYTVQGDGDPVILIHGMAASLYDWEALMPALARSGYRSYALDLPGHGGSAKPDDPEFYRADSVYRQMNDWIDSLGLTKPPILVCHSLGGYFGLQFGLLRPQQLRALVLIDPFYTPQQIMPIIRLFNRRPELSSKLLGMIPEWLVNFVLGMDPTSKNRFTETARRHIADDYKRASPCIMYIPASVVDLTPQLSQIQAWTLVIWGQRDLTLAKPSFPRLVEKLPKASGRSLPGCGHQPHIGSPDLIHKLLVEFFDHHPVDVGLS